MLIFGYDKIINGIPLTNGFKFKNGITPPNLGFAGYIQPDNISDKNLWKQKNNIKHENHYNNLKKIFDIKIKQVSKITDKYFYIIDVFTHDFWKDKNAKNILISDKAIIDIKNKKSKILILFPGESLHNYFDAIKIINTWIKKYNLPAESIILVDGNYKKYSKNIYIKHIPYSIWEHFFYNVYLNNKDYTKIFKNAIIEKKERKKIYLNYNRRPRSHRIKFVYNLKQKNIFNNGLVSLGKLENDSIKHFNNKYNISKSFLNNLPITFDNTDLEINHAGEIIQYDFLNSYVSIISETTTDKDNLFPTEKTWRPIVSLHPFMIIAAPGFLKMLHKFGYKTFSNWFDEKYDSEQNLDKRINMIINEIQKLTLKTNNELSCMLLDMLPTLEHNLENYIKRTKSKKFQKELENELWI